MGQGVFNPRVHMCGFNTCISAAISLAVGRRSADYNLADYDLECPPGTQLDRNTNNCVSPGQNFDGIIIN